MISRRRLLSLLGAVGCFIGTAAAKAGVPAALLPRPKFHAADGSVYDWDDVPSGIYQPLSSLNDLTDYRSRRAQIDDGVWIRPWHVSRAEELVRRQKFQQEHDILMEEIAKASAPPPNPESRARAAARAAIIESPEEQNRLRAEARAIFAREDARWRANHGDGIY